ncbi:HK97 family phage prohead protease [Bradyrhizobium sp. RD5-C2]|uniref:HK97 family phage prohead protease n=1 Tax=Bradyrhizobium sp. RD5-C2 TaxID=244562 RepID=UPI001CC50155|nr:HK97 family phage prohead protease [Bradyrhizobium sp. RD5-C2]GIQ76207.1 hypothetical protein BraRD5C2_46510 [Bradyrhizobium sp. RD5-C2]
MNPRDYETAAKNPFGLEYGGGGFISQIDGRSVVPAVKLERADDGKVLQGYACFYNKAAIIADGTVKVIRPGAFDHCLSNRRKVDFWLDHSSLLCVGSTRTGLELHTDNRGLAFRFKFPDTALGQHARQLADDKEYTAMSVGCSFKDYTVEEMEGLNVTIIRKADLEEISFVRRGAIEAAFGVLVEPRGPLAHVLDTEMANQGAFTAVIRALQKVQESLKNGR